MRTTELQPTSIKQLLLAAVASQLLAAFPSQGQGAAVIAVDADPNTAGIQQTVAVLPGAIFTVDIVATLDSDADSLSSYGVSARFDTNELNLNSSEELTPAGLSNLTAGVGSTSEDIGGGLGEVQTFEGVTFGNGPVGPVAVRLGTLTFTAANPSGDSSDIDITLGEFVSGVDASFDNSGARVTPTFVGAAVTAIPEPSALAFLGISGLAVLIGLLIRRRAARR